MKELKTRDFLVEPKEVLQRLGLPEGELVGAELTPGGLQVTVLRVEE